MAFGVNGWKFIDKKIICVEKRLLFSEGKPYRCFVVVGSINGSLMKKQKV
jgi:hypothetical protein